MNVIFHEKGATSIYKNDVLQKKLGKSWLLVYVDYLEKSGIEPESCMFLMPNGRHAKVFKTDNGWDWRML